MPKQQIFDFARVGFYGQRALSRQKLKELKRIMARRQAMIERAVGYKDVDEKVEDNN